MLCKCQADFRNTDTTGKQKMRRAADLQKIQSLPAQKQVCVELKINNKRQNHVRMNLPLGETQGPRLAGCARSMTQSRTHGRVSACADSLSTEQEKMTRTSLLAATINSSCSSRQTPSQIHSCRNLAIVMIEEDMYEHTVSVVALSRERGSSRAVHQSCPRVRLPNHTQPRRAPSHAAPRPRHWTVDHIAGARPVSLTPAQRRV